MKGNISKCSLIVFKIIWKTLKYVIASIRGKKYPKSYTLPFVRRSRYGGLNHVVYGLGKETCKPISYTSKTRLELFEIMSKKYRHMRHYNLRLRRHKKRGTLTL